MDAGRKWPQDGHRNLVVFEGTVTDEPRIVEKKWPMAQGTYTMVLCRFTLKNDAYVWGHIRPEEGATVPVVYRPGRLKMEQLHEGMTVLLVGRLQTREEATVIYTENVYSDIEGSQKDQMFEQLLALSRVFPDWIQVPF